MTPPSDSTLPDLSGLTVLVLDDNDDAVELLTAVLKACRADILISRNAAAALAYIDSAPRLDVIVADLAMPRMDGLTFARKVRQHPVRAALPIVALTAFYEDYPETREFDAYLRKPVDLDRLCRTIQRLARR